MLDLWYFLAAGMVAAWAVFDGFDLGVGALSPFLAKKDDEKRAIFAAIGPFWDGNEVCLLAAGGTLLLAFPKAMTAGFSGFYLAMFFVVWSLIGRGLSIELRSHLQSPLWRAFWDFIFWGSSSLLAILVGAALGNVLRGVPLDETAYFTLPLFGDFTTTGRLGVLDWYTVLVGVFVLATLMGHGAMFLLWKTTGEVQTRARALAPKLWIAIVALWVLSLLATMSVTPSLLDNFLSRPLAWPPLLVALGGVGLVFWSRSEGRELLGFLGSCAMIVGLLVTAAACAFPVLLRSSLDPKFTLDISNSAGHESGLSTGLTWWIPAFLIAGGYFVYVFRTYRGKAEASQEH